MKIFKFLIFTVLLLSFFSCSTKTPGYYHVLLLKYAKGTPQKEIANDVLRFKDIPAVINVAIGKIEPNKRNTISNFNYSVVLTFKNKQGLENYLKHPYHKKIYTKHKPFIKSIYTADFKALKLN